MLEFFNACGEWRPDRLPLWIASLLRQKCYGPGAEAQDIAAVRNGPACGSRDLAKWEAVNLGAGRRSRYRRDRRSGSYKIFAKTGASMLPRSRRVGPDNSVGFDFNTSTSHSGSIKPDTWTKVQAGRISEKSSPCARAASFHLRMSVSRTRVRIILYHARNSSVRHSLARRNPRVLVDEFQDTDPLQAEILWLLCGDGDDNGSWTTRTLRPGSLFLVGDPKQAIYRFRGADVDPLSPWCRRPDSPGNRASGSASRRS
jgi:hypothetical protein